MFSLASWKKSIRLIDGPVRTCHNPFDQDATQRVRIARIAGPWHPAMARSLERAGVQGLELSFQNGFAFDDPGFLAQLPFITLFTIPEDRSAAGHGPLPIEALSGLRRIQAGHRVAQPVDLAGFPHLTSLTMQWQPRLTSVFDTTRLTRLQIRSLDGRKADGLAHLTSLENLEIAHSGLQSFQPLAALTGLRRLSLSVCHKLPDLEGIGALQALRCLHLDEVPRITDLDCLTGLGNLECLTISDARQIASVAPLEALQNLKALWIAGARTTITDGDLSPLTRLPKLAMLTVGNKRHYSHRAIKPWHRANFETPDRLLEPRR